MIRKEGKGRWTYTCKLCGIKATSSDQFRAIERQQRHEATFEHASKPLADSISVFAEAIKEVGMTFVEAIASGVKPLADAIATPPNLPHDPSLLSDRRKWGGR